MTQEQNTKTRSANAEKLDADTSQALGPYLQRERQKKQQSIQDVAEFTRIPPEILKALEAGNRNLLPVSVFTKGFVKIYAAHLGLDQADILERFSSEWGAVDNSTPEILSGESMAESSPFLLSFRFYFLLLLIALFLSLAYFFFQADETPPPASLTAVPPAAQHGAKQVVTESQEIKELQIIASGPSHEIPLVSPQSAGKIMLEDDESAPDAALAEKGAEGDVDRPEKSIANRAETAHGQKIISQNQDPRRPLLAAITPPGQKILPPAPALSESVNLHIRFVKRTHIAITQDDGQLERFIFAPGEESTWHAARHITLQVDTADAVELTLNGSPLTLDDRHDGPLAITLPTDLDR